MRRFVSRRSSWPFCRDSRCSIERIPCKMNSIYWNMKRKETSVLCYMDVFHIHLYSYSLPGSGARTFFLLTPVAVHPLDWPPLGNRTRQSHEYQDFGQNLLFISNKETANFDGMDNLNCCRNEVRKVTGTSPSDAESLIKNWPIAPLLIGNCTASRTHQQPREKKYEDNDDESIGRLGCSASRRIASTGRNMRQSAVKAKREP